MSFDIHKFIETADELDSLLNNESLNMEGQPVPEDSSSEGKKLLIIGNKNEFLVKRIVCEAEEGGYAVTVCPPEIGEVSAAGLSIRLYLFFVDSAELRKDLLVYLRDTAFDRRTEIGLVGEKLDLQEAVKYLGADNAGKLFERPVDARQICDGVDLLAAIAEKKKRRKRILVVDDDPVCLKKAQAFLHKYYKVYTARSAFAAVRELTKHDIDLILLDYVMPVIDGPRFLKALRLEPETETVPIIFLSGQTDSRSVIEAMTLGSESYISKELSQRDLLTTISDFFAKKDWENR